MRVATIILLILLSSAGQWAEQTCISSDDASIDIKNKINELESEISERQQVIDEIEREIDAHIDESNQWKPLRDINNLLNELQELEAKTRVRNEYREELLSIKPELCLPIAKLTGPLEKLFAHGYAEVNCDGDTAGPGWTIIQRRNGGTAAVNRSWMEYTSGFGQVNENYFIGLDRLYELTSSTPHELYIHLENLLGEVRYAKYSEFRIGGAHLKYKLNKLGHYCGNAGDSLRASLYQQFRIYSQNYLLEDEQQNSFNTGWWTQRNSDSWQGNLNVPVWHTWITAFNYVKMMIRPQMNATNWCKEK